MPSAAAAPPPPPPPAAQLPAEDVQRQAFVFLARCAAAMLAVSQLMVNWTVGRQADSVGSRLYPACAAALYTLFAVLAFAKAGALWRRRVWLVPAARVAIFCIPSFRRVGMGVSLLLARPAAAAGWKGALSDAARVVIGSRLVIVVVPALVLPLPPTVMLATQLLVTALSLNNVAYCSTELLLHPRMRDRISTLASIADCGAIVAPLLPPATALAFSGGWGPEDGRYERTCRSVLSFAQVSLGVLLPTLVSARWWRPNQARQPAAAGSRSSTSAAAAPKHAHLWCWAAAVRSRADDAMHTAMQCGDSALAAGIAYWWILSLLWMACSGPVRAP